MPSPSGTTVGASFFVDGSQVSWSDTFNSSIAVGQSVVLRANNGPRGVNYWTATAGTHSVMAFVDDINRFPYETNEGNNKLTVSLSVGTTGGGTGEVAGTRWGGAAGAACGDYDNRSTIYNGMKYMGISRLRCDLRSTTDNSAWVQEAIDNGLKPLPILMSSSPAAEATMADWVYQKGVREVELLNEPDLHGWTASSYITFAKDTIARIRAQHPDMTILVGALSQSTATTDYTSNGWIPKMGAAGLWNIDPAHIVLSYHAYLNEYAPGPTTSIGARWSFLTGPGLDYFFGMVDAYDATHTTKIWVSEGANASRGYPGITESIQAGRASAVLKQINDAWLKKWRNRLGPIYFFQPMDKPDWQDVGNAYEHGFGAYRYSSTLQPYLLADALKGAIATPVQ